jgi:hypothetical protein
MGISLAIAILPYTAVVRFFLNTGIVLSSLQVQVLMQRDNVWLYSLLSAPFWESAFGKSGCGEIYCGRKGVCKEGTRTSAEQQKALVRRYYQAWSAGEPDVLDEVLAPSELDHDPAAGQ